MAEDIIVPIAIFGTIFGILYVFFTTRNKERLALIEKGMDPNLASSDFWIQVGIIGGGAAFFKHAAGLEQRRHGQTQIQDEFFVVLAFVSFGQAEGRSYEGLGGI